MQKTASRDDRTRDMDTIHSFSQGGVSLTAGIVPVAFTYDFCFTNATVTNLSSDARSYFEARMSLCDEKKIHYYFKL
jgi:hypothetical protein